MAGAEQRKARLKAVLENVSDSTVAVDSDLSRPPRGVITPSFHATPQPSEVQRGLSGGVYRGCLCDRDGKGNKRGQILT